MKTRQKSKPKKYELSKGKQKAPESKADRMTRIYIRVLYTDIVDNTLNTDICISGDTIDWIITVSNLICDPSGMATFTHIRRAHRLTGTIRREMLIGDKSPLVTPSYQESMNLCSDTL